MYFFLRVKLPDSVILAFTSGQEPGHIRQIEGSEDKDGGDAGKVYEAWGPAWTSIAAARLLLYHNIQFTTSTFDG